MPKRMENDVMFCKDVRWGEGGLCDPPIEIGGYKMIDVGSALYKAMRK